MSKTISEHLTLLNNTKTAIKQAIIDKGVSVDDTTVFSDYPAKISSISTGSTPDPSVYVRPTDWLTLPTSSSEQFVGLYAVFNTDGNFISIKCSGAYTINWGDGTTENIASGTQANHKYNYSSFADTTICSRGYKQAIVTITPQSGAHLTSIILDLKHNTLTSYTDSVYSTGWLDICISNCSNLSTLNISKDKKIRQSLLEKFNIIGTNSITSCQGLFKNCYVLKSIAMDSSKSTNFAAMFENCYALETVPSLNTTNGTDFNSMFDSCYALKTIPLINTSKSTDFNYMFYYCYSLKTIPLLDSSNVTDFSNMFANCYVLETLPSLNTTNGTNFASMFGSCTILKRIPFLNTSKGVDFCGIFDDCSNLETIPNLDTSRGKDFRYMFRRCYSLQTLPTLVTSAIVEDDYANQMFDECFSLQSISLQGMAKSFSIANCKLSTDSLVSIFSGLATVTGKTITIANTYGLAALTDAQKAIATNKGWTIATTVSDDW